MVALKRLLAGSLATTVLTSSAFAGGFQRGTADTDILYERGGFSMRTGITYVDPQRGFDSVNGVSGDFGDYTGDYIIPSYAFGFGNDLLGCAGTYTISFAADGDYASLPGGAVPAPADGSSFTRTRTLEFDSNEFGLTCRLSYEMENGHRLSVLGGAFAEDFNFNATALSTTVQPGPLPGSAVLLSTAIDAEADQSFQGGYRVGLAYEVPDIALRVQALYRSEVRHDDITGTGTVTTGSASLALPGGGTIPLDPTTPGLPPVGTVIPAAVSLNEATSPQSLYLNAQTGIAAGTLLLASFRWTDWSSNRDVVVTLDTPLGSSQSVMPYRWRDGYTGSLGIGRAFTDTVSGVVAVGYDRGVSTGAETTYTDLYTLSAGMSFKPEKWAEVRIGGLVGYWTDGEQSVEDGANFDGTVGDDFVYALSASMKFTF
ncbi:outer membrane protein transport protein [Mangrovicella endophytica]|uniref:outer membrane protein transport protein n=1 Tax=Mangrovicella endophytica TaxID=2066697 RepID=UPI000C9E8CC0|nr:outer membrane protein transport protein [Mangrovicella endophytica]